MQHYAIKFVSEQRQVGRFLRVLHQKTYRDDMPKILLKVALNTINQTNPNRYNADIFDILLQI